MLVYAIARLLPGTIAGAFDFSTYEPPHSSLRTNKVARVIGSYSRNGLDRAESDALQRKGFVLDTFPNSSGPGKVADRPWLLEELLDLAAAKNWPAIDKLRDDWSKDQKITEGATTELLAEVFRIRPLIASLKDKTLGVKGLKELAQLRLGKSVIVDHLKGLLQDLQDKARRGTPDHWLEEWSAIKSFIPDDSQRKEAAEKLFGAQGDSRDASKVSSQTKVKLLNEWSGPAQQGQTIPNALLWLLSTSSEQQFLELLSTRDLQSPHRIQATILTFNKSAWRPNGLLLLSKLSPKEFNSFLADLADLESSACRPTTSLLTSFPMKQRSSLHRHRDARGENSLGIRSGAKSC